MKKFINTGSKDTRSGFGSGLAELGRKNKNVVALCADLIGSLKMDEFISENPDRFFQVGIAEACLLYTSPSPRDATLSRMPSSA